MPVLRHHDGLTGRRQIEAHRHYSGRSLRVELRRGFIESQEMRLQDQHRGELDALAFSAGERLEPPTPQAFDAEAGQHLLHAVVHPQPRQPYVLEPEGDLSLHRAVDRLRLDVLEDKPGVSSEPWDGRPEGIEANDQGTAGDPAAVELRDQAVE